MKPGAKNNSIKNRKTGQPEAQGKLPVESGYEATVRLCQTSCLIVVTKHTDTIDFLMPDSNFLSYMALPFSLVFIAGEFQNASPDPLSDLFADVNGAIHAPDSAAY